MILILTKIIVILIFAIIEQPSDGLDSEATVRFTVAGFPGDGKLHDKSLIVVWKSVCFNSNYMFRVTVQRG